MNLFLLVWDMFSFVFWENPRPEKKRFEIIWPLLFGLFPVAKILKKKILLTLFQLWSNRSLGHWLAWPHSPQFPISFQKKESTVFPWISHKKHPYRFPALFFSCVQVYPGDAKKGNSIPTLLNVGQKARFSPKKSFKVQSKINWTRWKSLDPV